MRRTESEMKERVEAYLQDTRRNSISEQDWDAMAEFEVTNNENKSSHKVS